MKKLIGKTSSAMVLALTSLVSIADSTDAACEIYPKGSDQATALLPCTFSQRQGYIHIARSDGTNHELSPVGDTPGTYKDSEGHDVYRESGLADQGQIFRFPDESVFVYWGTGRLAPAGSNGATAPFSTDDYDATTILRCTAPGKEGYETCPAGILRMEDGQASIVVQNVAGEQFTINFMKDYVNATNREVDAHLDGDTWVVTINKNEVYEVPRAAIEGG